MNFSYIVNIDGYELLHECSYHTREVLENGMERLAYPRFHNSNGTVRLDFISLYDPKLQVYRCALEIKNETNHDVRIRRADIGVSFETKRTLLKYFSSDWGSEYSPCEQEMISIGPQEAYPNTCTPSFMASRIARMFSRR